MVENLQQNPEKNEVSERVLASPKWRCHKCGRCCRINKYTTEEEFNLAREKLKEFGIELLGSRIPHNLILWPTPCPALDKDNNCLIYEVRPFPCRQFFCGKRKENDCCPWKSDGTFNIEYHRWLLANNKEFAEFKEKMEDEAAEWGLRHGWKLVKAKKSSI